MKSSLTLERKFLLKKHAEVHYGCRSCFALFVFSLRKNYCAQNATLWQDYYIVPSKKEITSNPKTSKIVLISTLQVPKLTTFWRLG